MIRRLVVVILLMGGAYLLVPLRVPTEGVIAPTSLFLFGILLLAADTLGALAHDLRIPRIVGYVVAGVALGPSVTGLVPADVLQDLGMMKNLALGLIGLLAGAELRIGDLRQRWRSIVAILGFQVVFVALAVVPAMALLRPLLPFGDSLPWVPFLAVAALFAVMMMANSPMVVLALLAEGHSHGPLAKTTLSVVLVADVVVIFLFTAALSGAAAVVGPLAGAGTEPGALVGVTAAAPVFLALTREIGASILAGGVIGAILTLYVRYVKRELVLFAVVVVFATAAAADALHFELLLSLLVAGFLFENVAPVRAEPLIKALELAGTPVFVVFFALTAAELPLASFASLWVAVLVLAAVRVAALWGANRLGVRVGGGEDVVGREGWAGLVPQAGVALGFAALVAQEFPTIGIEIQALTVGIVTLNTTVGPILFRQALGRAGELTE